MVEQGTENPRVGGSIPSLATTSLLLLLPLTLGACGSDDCQTLCRDLAFALDGCRATWGATWEDLGASSRTEYRRSCEDTWDTVRADLETRQITAAEGECEDAAVDLADLGCDELRALYL